MIPRNYPFFGFCEKCRQWTRVEVVGKPISDIQTVIGITYDNTYFMGLQGQYCQMKSHPDQEGKECPGGIASHVDSYIPIVPRGKFVEPFKMPSVLKKFIRPCITRRYHSTDTVSVTSQ